MFNFILEYWLEVLFGIMVTLTGVLIKKVNSEISKQESVTMGLRALLKDRIVQAYHHYMDKGCYPVYARENVNEMYVQYKRLGGNGMIDALIEKLNQLPTHQNCEEIL